MHPLLHRPCFGLAAVVTAPRRTGRLRRHRQGRTESRIPQSPVRRHPHPGRWHQKPRHHRQADQNDPGRQRHRPALQGKGSHLQRNRPLHRRPHPGDRRRQGWSRRLVRRTRARPAVGPSRPRRPRHHLGRRRVALPQTGPRLRTWSSKSAMTRNSRPAPSSSTTTTTIPSARAPARIPPTSKPTTAASSAARTPRAVRPRLVQRQQRRRPQPLRRNRSLRRARQVDFPDSTHTAAGTRRLRFFFVKRQTRT
jgi:hypothetical protein